MDDKIAEKLNVYNSAYNAVCQWCDDIQESANVVKRESPTTSFTLDSAKDWASKLQNEDGSFGPHWTMDQTKQIMAQRNLSLNPTEFWMALNLVYSDFSPVAKKHGVGGNLDFYIDMAKSFLVDKDAAPDKLLHYYNYIVK